MVFIVKNMQLEFALASGGRPEVSKRQYGHHVERVGFNHRGNGCFFRGLRVEVIILLCFNFQYHY